MLGGRARGGSRVSRQDRDAMAPAGRRHKAMNLDFSDDQKLLREQVRRYLAANCPSEKVRAVLEGPADFDRDLYKGLADLGVLGAAVPEAYGGVGLGHLELCVLA